jgi:hypothetical protein
MGGGGSKSTEVPETASERALAEVSAGKWKMYQDQFVPLENQYMREVDNLGSAGSQQRLATMAMNKAGESTLGLQTQLNQQSFAKGIDPSSGQYQTKSMVLNGAIQRTKDNAYAQGMNAAKNAHLQGIGNVVAMGSGQDTTAFNGFGNLANTAARSAIGDTGRDFQKSLDNQQLTGQVLGATAGYGVNSYFKTPTPNPVGLDTSIPNTASNNTVSLSGGSGYGFSGSAPGFSVSRFPTNNGGFN